MGIKKFLLPPIAKAFSFSFLGFGIFFSQISIVFKQAWMVIFHRDTEALATKEDKEKNWQSRWGVEYIDANELKRILGVMRFEVYFFGGISILAIALLIVYIFNFSFFGIFFSIMMLLYSIPNILLTSWRMDVLVSMQYKTMIQWIKGG